MSDDLIGPSQMADGQTNYLIGNTVDTNVARGVAGRGTVNFASDANLTLDSTEGTDEWRDVFLEITDTDTVLTTGRNVVFPSKQGPACYLTNSTAQTLTCKLSGQTGVAVLAGETVRIYNDGTDMVELGLERVTRRYAAGRQTVDFSSDANLTLTTDQATDKFLTLTDTGVVLTTGRDVVFPDIEGPEYIVKNSTAQTLTLKLSGQTGVTLAASATGRFYNDGSDMVAGP